MPKKHSVLMEIPHGGTCIPEEVRSLLMLSEKDLIADTDRGVMEIAKKQPTLREIVFPTWYSILNANREPNDFSEDGIVTTKTSSGVQIWKNHNGLPPDISKRLVEKYVKPYYEEILEILNRGDISAIISLHTMSPFPPVNSRFDENAKKGKARPLITMLNHGDMQGNPDENELFYADGMQYIKDLIKKNLHLFNLEEVRFDKENPIGINEPFGTLNMLSRLGGRDKIPYNTQSLALEFNRDLLTIENIPHVRNLVTQIIKEVAKNTRA